MCCRASETAPFQAVIDCLMLNAAKTREVNLKADDDSCFLHKR